MFTLLVLVLIVAVVIAMQPNTFQVSRSTTINAPADKIFLHIDTLPSWEAWSPWAKLDPNATTVFAGPSSGVGAVMSWEGNMQVGKGSMTIIDSKPDLIRLRLDFQKPMAATNNAQFLLKGSDSGKTQVTWSMQGDKNFIAKAMHLVMNCDKMIGGQFEKGLTNLKGVVEGKQ